MPSTGGGKRQQILPQRRFVGSAVRPKCSSGFPVRPQAFIVRHSVLDNECCDSLRMGQRHAKSDRTSIILQVERVTLDFQRLGKGVHELRDVIKGVLEMLRIGPVAMTES